MDNLQVQLNDIINRWNLLNHPFYRAWSEGTLPAEKLKTYAGEYGAFINCIPAQWRTVGNDAIAAEEQMHFGLWQDFAKSLGVPVIKSTVPEVIHLVDLSNHYSNTKATALGALYAFEAQQPHTTTSKQDGLKKFYSNIGADDRYFIIHMDDDHEVEILYNKIQQLSPADQQKALDACENACHALWDALTGIMGDTDCAMN
jgi:pyrroloquinoline-quinone synthase